MGCHFLFQGILPVQGSNLYLLCVLHCGQILNPLSHEGSPYSMGWEQWDKLSLYPALDSCDLPNPVIKPRSPTLQVDSLPAEPQGKPKNTGVGSLSLLQEIFPTQESNQGLLYYRWILYQLSHQGSELKKRRFKQSKCFQGEPQRILLLKTFLIPSYACPFTPLRPSNML